LRYVARTRQRSAEATGTLQRGDGPEQCVVWCPRRCSNCCANHQLAAVTYEADQYAAAWSTFERLEQAAYHRRDWADWVAGRGPHLLLLAPVVDPAVHAAVAQAQDALRQVPGLELHPPDFLHLSIQSFGFLAPPGRPKGEGELTFGELGAAIPALASRLARVPAFDVHVGGLNALHSAAFLETSSAGHLQGLRYAVREAASRMLKRIDPYPDYLFHLTVGYFGSAADLSAARLAILPLRVRTTTRLRLDRLELVRLPTDQREPYPAFESLAYFPLSANQG
jgi:hypothetical protein